MKRTLTVILDDDYNTIQFKRDGVFSRSELLGIAKQLEIRATMEEVEAMRAAEAEDDKEEDET